jgi:hypothetical protein
MIMTAIILLVLKKTMGLSVDTDSIDQALHEYKRKSDILELEGVENKNTVSVSESKD